jgi:hypothetical protein
MKRQGLRSQIDNEPGEICVGGSGSSSHPDCSQGSLFGYDFDSQVNGVHTRQSSFWVAH